MRIQNNLSRQELIQKITSKREFSDLPKKDVEMIFDKFDNEKYLDEEKIKLSRDFLRKVYSVFASEKLLKNKSKDFEWLLKKHISTKERFDSYKDLYERLFRNFDKNKNLAIFDLGCGINGFSYPFFKQARKDLKIEYVGIEAIGQLVNLQNNYFQKEKINGKVIHESLFNIEKIKQILSQGQKPKIIFLFKVLDSLEMIKRDYSKTLLIELSKFVDEIIISFATKSLVKKKKFNVQRNWIVNFIKGNFKIINDFELANERYLSFKK